MSTAAICCADWNSTYKHPKKVALKQFEDNDCYVLITGDGKDPSTDDYSQSDHAADDAYAASDDAIRNAVGMVVVTVAGDGRSYTVRAEGFEKTFSAVDAENLRP